MSGRPISRTPLSPSWLISGYGPARSVDNGRALPLYSPRLPKFGVIYNNSGHLEERARVCVLPSVRPTAASPQI